MRTILSLAMILLLVTLACAPTGKVQYLDQYESFVDDVKVEYASYDDRDWERKNEAMRFFLEEEYPEYKHEMTDEEKAQVWSEAFSYYMIQYGEEGLDHFQEHKEIYMEMVEESADLAVEIIDQLSEDVIPELQKHMPEIRLIGEDIIRNLERKGTFERLEDSLEDFGKRMEELGKELEREMEEHGEDWERKAEEWEKKAEEWEKEAKKREREVKYEL
jgi:hypothetical protein